MQSLKRLAMAAVFATLVLQYQKRGQIKTAVKSKRKQSGFLLLCLAKALKN